MKGGAVYLSRDTSGDNNNFDTSESLFELVGRITVDLVEMSVSTRRLDT